MRPDGESWRIIDLLLDGHSVVNAEIQEYATVLASNNGDINALIAFMLVSFDAMARGLRAAQLAV